MSDDDNLASPPAWPEIVRKIRARTPARIFVRRGPSYTTQMSMELRTARASAVDAVWAEFDLQRDLPVDFVGRYKLFQVSSQAESKSQFLLRPDLGRKLSDAGKKLVAERCIRSPDIQFVIGDGLSGAALSEQLPALFPLLLERAHKEGWTVGSPFVVQYCRVGIMNDVGDLLSPQVIVLLIGERPGLAAFASLSAYMAYRPNANRTDADRNLVSNIQAHGLRPDDAADRITNLASQMLMQKRSGTILKESALELPNHPPPRPLT
jgi:ethanolamine ammonia-lyase small subunit